MADLVVINTGPLIALERAGALSLPTGLPMRLVCPAEVRRELDVGHEAGYPLINPDWLEVMPLATKPSPAMLASLDLGEAAVIQLAIELSADGACIDEWRGRRVARAAGLPVFGSLGLFGMAKKQGLVESIRPFVDRALAGGVRYHPKLVQAVFEELNEI